MRVFPRLSALYIIVDNTMCMLDVPGDLNIANGSWKQWGFIHFLNCEYIPVWAAFRQKLRSLGLPAALFDVDAIASAEALLHAHAGPHDFEGDNERLTPVIHSSFHRARALEFHAQLVGDSEGPSDDGYCHLGFITALWLRAVARRVTDVTRAAQELDIARTLLGNSFCFDFLSDSEWPIRWGMLYAPPDSRRAAIRARAAAIVGKTSPTLLSRIVDPQGCTFWRTSPPYEPPSLRVRLAIVVDHAALSLDLAETAQAVLPDARIVFVCQLGPSGGSGFESDHAVAHVGCGGLCKIMPTACARIEQFVAPPLEKDLRWLRNHDVVGCFRYKLCQTLWREDVPVALVDGNFLVNPFHIRSAFPGNVLSEFAALDALVVHDVYVRRRSGHERPSPCAALPIGAVCDRQPPGLGNARVDQRPPVVVVATDPWQAENLFQCTGHRVPSVRPLALYAANCARPVLRPLDVFLSHDRGRCLPCETFARVLIHNLPHGFPLRLVRSKEYWPLCALAGFRAAVIVPHGNIVMQLFRELHTLRVPLHVPDREFLVRQPLLWFFRRLESGLPTGWRPPFLPRQDPQSLQNSTDGVVFSAWIPDYAEGRARLTALQWWAQFLDYLHWPGVRTFGSVADLLQALALPPGEIGRAAVDRFLTAMQKDAMDFWGDAFARLLGSV